jgi:hypothetical protein
MLEAIAHTDQDPVPAERQPSLMKARCNQFHCYHLLLSHHHLSHAAGTEVERLTARAKHERLDARIDETRIHLPGAHARSTFRVADDAKRLLV